MMSSHLMGGGFAAMNVKQQVIFQLDYYYMYPPFPTNPHSCDVHSLLTLYWLWFYCYWHTNITARNQILNSFFTDVFVTDQCWTHPTLKAHYLPGSEVCFVTDVFWKLILILTAPIDNLVLHIQTVSKLSPYQYTIACTVMHALTCSVPHEDLCVCCFCNKQIVHGTA